jgi:signal transduction histidine kinase
MRTPSSEFRSAVARAALVPIALLALLSAVLLAVVLYLRVVGLALAVALVVAVALLLSFGAVRTLRHMARVFDEALRARDDFIAVAAHELKNPLTAFRLQVETLSRVLQRSGPEVSLARIERGVAAMQQSAARFVELVNRLLDVSRLSAGGLRLDVKELDLAQVVTECVERMRPELEHSGATLELHAEPSVGRWDRLRVESVVTNLLSNAVKYGLGRPVEISVEEVSEHIRLTVSDHGIGIELEDQERIFGRYERAVPAGAYEGLGIGLWLTRAIVEAHGGTIQVESRPGKGATFVVLLPNSLGTRDEASTSTARSSRCSARCRPRSTAR